MIIVILGPTAVGKTKMGIELAKKMNGEVINADSTQVYEGMNIATNKATETEMEGIKHHLMDIKKIEEDYTVYDYQKDCRNIIDNLLKKGKTPILVGGTGLYIKAALYNYNFETTGNKKDYSTYTNEELYEMLKKVDPKTEIHQNNRKRVENALNYYEETNKPYSQKEKNDQLIYKKTIFIGLTIDREQLYERINQRVDIMEKQGLIKEAKYYYDRNIRTKAVLTPIGYKELFPYFEGKENLESCLAKIKQQSRKYAKRQYTWFKNQMDINWFTVNLNNFQTTVTEVMNFIENIDSKKQN